jgi:hypothetical protein
MSGRVPAPEASSASCQRSQPPADALDAVAEDPRRAVPAGTVRGGRTGHIRGVGGVVSRTPDGADRLGSGSPDPLKLEHHRSRNGCRKSCGRLADQPMETLRF